MVQRLVDYGLHEGFPYSGYGVVKAGSNDQARIAVKVKNLLRLLVFVGRMPQCNFMAK